MTQFQQPPQGYPQPQQPAPAPQQGYPPAQPQPAAQPYAPQQYAPQPQPQPAAPPYAPQPQPQAPAQGYAPVMPGMAPPQAMAPAQMSQLFAGIENARPGNDVNYIRAGHYWMRVDCNKIGTNPTKQVPFASNELTVVHVFENGAGQGHNLGESVASYSEAGLYFQKDIQSFIGPMTQLPPELVTQQICNEVYGNNQVLRGLCVEVRAHQQPTKKNNPVTGQPGVFTKISYVREVPASELMQFLPPEVQAKFWPNNALTAMAAQEAPAPQAPQQLTPTPAPQMQPGAYQQPMPAAPPQAPPMAPAPQMAPQAMPLPPGAPGAAPAPLPMPAAPQQPGGFPPGTAVTPIA